MRNPRSYIISLLLVIDDIQVNLINNENKSELKIK